MPHNRRTFSDGQLWQLRYKGAFTLVDSSCTAVAQLAESKDENVYIVACHFYSFQQKLRIRRKKSPSTSAETKRSPIVASKHGVVRLRSTNAYAPSLLQSNQNARLLIMSKHGFNFGRAAKSLDRLA
jgi:hypothetical protein